MLIWNNFALTISAPLKAMGIMPLDYQSPMDDFLKRANTNGHDDSRVAN